MQTRPFEQGARLVLADWNAYEQKIVLMMKDHDLSMMNAIMLDMTENEVDTDCILDMVDYLEEQTDDLNRVSVYMGMITGQGPDYVISQDT